MTPTSQELEPPAIPARFTVAQDEDVVRAALRFFTLRGDQVLDPFAGAGTTGRVALEEGRVPTLGERETGFCARMRRTLSLTTLVPGERLRAWAPGADLQLSLGNLAHSRLRAAFHGRSTVGTVSARVRDMAARASRLTGVQIPPEMVAVLLRAERDHYYARSG